jgi:hypothetical protein
MNSKIDLRYHMKQAAWLSETRADHSLKSLYLGFWHLVAAGEIVSREQEHLLNACFLSRLQKTLCATLWWTE